MKTGIGKMIIKAAETLLIFLSFIYLYTLLHEGGHALVGMMYGGRIDSFVLGFNAHVTISGANYTRTGESLLNLAGVLLPVIFLVVALKFYNRNIKNLVYHYIYAVVSIAITGSLFAWIAIPLISLFATPPAGDDVSKFLKVSGLNPLLVSLIALLVMILIVLISCKKGIYSKAMEYLKSSSQVERPRLNIYQIVTLVLVIIFLGSFAYVSFQKLMPEKVFETSFSMNVIDDLKVMKMPFEIKRDRSYNMNLRLDAEGMLTDIQICDDKGNTIYQDFCEQLTLSSSLDLKTGNYLFVLTFIRDPEVMAQYFEEKEYGLSQEYIDLGNYLLKTRIINLFRFHFQQL